MTDMMTGAFFVLLSIVVVFNLFLTIALLRRLNRISGLDSRLLPSGSVATPSDLLRPGDIAQEFNGETLEGENVRLSSLTNRESVLILMSPNCRPCRDIIPTLNDAYPIATEAGVNFLLVSLSTRDAAQAFAAEANIQVPVIVPSSISTFSHDYKAFITPSYYLIGIDGRVKSGGLLDDAWNTLVETWRVRPSGVGHLKPV